MSLDSLFEPDNVAIIGASREGGKVGHSILRNFMEEDFGGEIYPVNPEADSILGLRSYESVLDIPGEVDLGVVTVPPTAANSVIEEAVEKGVNNLIVITSGYGEIGGEGVEREEELEDILEGSDTRLVGPNCLGVYDSFSGVDTLFLPSYKLKRPPEGDIAIVTQSGAFGSAVMDLLADMEVGISRFVSYGNQADVTETELLEWLDQDDETEAIAVYMEGVSDGEKFLEKARKVTEDKPIVALKGGKYGSGREAVSSHTGSLAGSYEVYRGVFSQARILEADNIEQLFDYSRALAYNKPLDGRNIAVVTNGGGFGVLTADALEEQGLKLAEYSTSTEEQLREAVPDYGNVENPLDLVGDADSKRYERSLEVLEKDPNIDGIIVIPLLQPLPLESDVIDAIVNFNEGYTEPLVVCMTGGEYTGVHAKNLEKNEVAAYSSPKRAVDAMEALYRYGDWRS
ncbi:MAG: CoA-binding protein [Candidatus Nanohaloarchaeota archaeon QJJ-7]|nr:CoA-binding protein [Candidatus Nanohaloarchaeota archaeon QJJ-7]